MRRALLPLLLVGCLPPSGHPLPPDTAAHPLVREARLLRNVPYRWDGRMDAEHPDLDCMGLVLVTFQKVYGTPWQDHSSKPTTLIGRNTLGTPVPGLDGVASDDIDFDLLRPGDVVFILRYDANPEEPSLTELAGRAAWVWHMGLYAGGPEHRMIHADPFHETINEVPLAEYLSSFWLDNEGIYVVRPPPLP